jgi:N-acetyl-gamma-glutamyl-phosphate reductase common form
VKAGAEVDAAATAETRVRAARSDSATSWGAAAAAAGSAAAGSGAVAAPAEAAAPAPAASRRDEEARAAPAVPVLVLGGSGYVAGELLRLVAGHPRLALAGVVSESQPGQAVVAAFPHLAGALPEIAFSAPGELPRLVAGMAETGRRSDSGGGTDAVSGSSAESDTATGAGVRTGSPLAAALCAAPHGASAPLIDGLLDAAERAGVRLRVIDLSADFRFASAAEYEAVYGRPHGAPARLAGFHRGLPEHAAVQGLRRGAAGWEVEHVGHPGCFPTAVLLAAVPLLRLGLVEPCLQVVAVTGSTGAGRTPGPTTHHPARRSNLFAYNPLVHRHEPEMRALAAAACGVAATDVEIHFVPQAGPFARGIYATVQARLCRPLGAEEVAAALAGFYAAAPFVEVGAEPPRLQDVVGSNRCRLAVAARGDRLVAFSALDNLVKGAAGGAVQWLNAMLGLPETMGLNQPGLGWL